MTRWAVPATIGKGVDFFGDGVEAVLFGDGEKGDDFRRARVVRDDAVCQHFGAFVGVTHARDVGNVADEFRRYG